MRCLQLQSPLLPLHAKLKHQLHHISHTSKLFFLSTHQPPRVLHLPSSPLSTKALPHFMVVAPAESGDLSSLLPISGVLLSMYLVANFVVPGFLANSFANDKSNEEQKVDNEDDTEDEEEDEDEDEVEDEGEDVEDEGEDEVEDDRR